jgi:serine protease SohB
LNDAGIGPVIEKAFAKGKPVAVALEINSPGGSPVQSSLIGARIRRLADDKGLKVHAFVEDVAASGGYWLATAADDIWIDRNSIVGSIGVISAGFGFSELIERHGIERRVYTAGQSKSMLDPFKPEKAEDVARVKALQEDIHANFIAHVKARRGARLADQDLFTGDVWIGERAIEMGLADGIAHATPKLKELYGKTTKIVPYQRKRSFLSRFGAEFAADAAGLVEERAAFARFGI